MLAGHSAGGHLAMWSGLRAGPDVVRRIVALAPVTDVWYAARAGLDDNAAQELLGGEPSQVPDAYAECRRAAARPWSRAGHDHPRATPTRTCRSR